MNSINPRFSVKMPRFSGLAMTILAIAMVVVSQGRAQAAAYEIVATENSSTSLSVTLNGSASGVSILPVQPDKWLVTLPFTADVSGSALADFAEPGSDTTSNDVYFIFTAGQAVQLAVTSEFFSSAPFPNGGTAFFTAPDNKQIAITFNDNGDGPVGVPDTGTGLGLMSLSLAALFGASNLRRVLG